MPAMAFYHARFAIIYNYFFRL